MNLLLTIVVVVQVLSALGVIVLVLLQHGKGADMGAAFGSGSSGSLFGASGSANFLSRTTGALATVFLLSTLGLAMLTAKTTTVAPRSVMDQPGAAESSVPAAPGSSVSTIPGSSVPTVPGSSVPAAPASSVPAAPGAPSSSAAGSSAPAAAPAIVAPPAETKPSDGAVQKSGRAGEIPK